MKLQKTIIAAASLFSAVLTCPAQGTAFTYQGRLNSGGGPASGSHHLVFAVYDTNAPAGNLVAGPVTNSAVAVSNGLFTVTLDFGAGVFAGNPRWLEIAVRTNGGSAFTTLAPRQPVTPAPYAIMANSASNLLGTVSAGQINGAIPSAAVAGTYGNAVSFNNGADNFDGTFLGQFYGSSFTGGIFTGSFVGNGSGLYGLSPAQLPGNVAYVNSNQVFTAQNVFAQGIGIGTTNPTSYYQIDALAGQSLVRLQTTNNANGAVVELRNTTTNAYEEYLGAINFNNFSNNYPGQIGYFSYPGFPGFDFLAIRIDGLDNSFRLQGDPSGNGADCLVNGANNFCYLGYGGNVITGGGSPADPNGIYFGGYNFIGTGEANQIASLTIYTSFSFIGGGYTNSIFSDYSFIGGGSQNSISTNADHAMIAGGYYNAIQFNAWDSAIAGGYGNVIQPFAEFAFIGGGNLNTIQPFDYHSVIGGGDLNTIQTNAHDAVISGGFGNTIQPAAINGVIGGGYTNTILGSAQFAAIGGGVSNNTAGSGGTVPGGFGNSANGLGSFAAGSYAQATNDGAFVLTDDQAANFYSTASNQLSARFTGGVRFVTGGAGVTVDGQKIGAASGSANYIQNQTVTAQAAGFDISGNAQIGGLIRSGSESGTSESPNPAGLVIRRVNSITDTSNTVVAVARNFNNTANINLVRDGTSGGYIIQYPALPGSLTIACMGMDSSGAQKNFYAALSNPGTAGFIQIYTSAQNIVHFECTFGITFSAGQHLTEATLSRFGADYFWSGNLISTYNQ